MLIKANISVTMALANIKRKAAARMTAEDLEPDYLIAKTAGVSRRSVHYCEKQPDVRARV